jgi:hypothetical protein
VSLGTKKENPAEEKFMKKLVTIAVAVAVVIPMLGAHYLQAQSNGRPSAPFKGANSPLAPVVLTNHALSRTFFDQAAPDVSVGSGFAAIDSPVTITCGNTAGCTIEAESWADPGSNIVAGNEWGICTALDGVTGVGICTFQGTLPSDNTFVTGSLNNSFRITKGTHTVQAMIYTDSGVFLAQYHNTYHLYVP